MSLQSNTPSSSDANVVEQTALRRTKRSSSSIELSIEPGTETSLLHWALTDLKETLHEITTKNLVDRNLASFVEHTAYIQVVDDMLDTIFAQLNSKFKEALHVNAGIDHEQHWKDEFAAQDIEVEKLRERFGWDE